jgi:hypothetical protein
VPNYYRFLLFFPHYLMKNWKTFYEIFVEDGALMLEEKLLVSIMVILFGGVAEVIRFAVCSIAITFTTSFY